jgi:multidrug efflux pump subunit AcrA (membrane-fusion protein)
MRLITMAGNKRLFGRSAKISRLFAFAVLICLGLGSRLAAEDLDQKFDGLVVARRSVQIVPQINGVVSRILFAAGQRVAQGDVLFEPNADALQIDVSTAQAELAEARARLTLAEDEAGRQAQLLAAHAGVAASMKQNGQRR